MRYLGGKARIAKDVVEVLESIRNDGQPYLEPFCGGCSVISRMSGERYAYDKHPKLISMYQKVQEGWTPPENVSEEEYKKAKDGLMTDHETGFIGFGCSFGGKYFGGYARGDGDRNYAKGSKNSLMKKMKTMQDVKFEVKDFLDLNISGFLIYCDPPYKGTTQYDTKTLGEFDHDAFWEKVRELSKRNTVIVSEFTAPNDFKSIWHKAKKTDLRGSDGEQLKNVENLFTINDITYFETNS